MWSSILEKLSAIFASRLPALVAVVAALPTTWLLWALLKHDPLAQFPIVGKGNRSARKKQYTSGGAWDLYEEGYRKFKDGVFRLTTACRSESIVVASKYLPELKKLPDDVLSFTEAANESLQAEYTHMDTNVPALPHTIKTMLTPALVRLNPTIAKEVVDAMTLELPQSHEWEEVDIIQKLLRIVAIISGRIFIGPELCRNERYLDAAINYTIDVMIAVHAVGLVPLWLRPYVASRLPFVKKVEKRLAESDDFLRPIVKARREASKDPNAAEPDDMLQWIINSQKKFGDRDDKEIAKLQLSISMAAIHTTTLTTTNALYTLAVMPELVPELQEDIIQAVAASNGEFSSSALQNMKKLDSFLKETMRYYPLNAASFQRKVLKPFTLSNGQLIPAGVIVEVPAGSISSDDDIFDDAKTFDALRFFKLRQSKGMKSTGTKAAEVVANSQFVSVSESSLTFGYGRHACPGRFFAANEIKMILANILLHYEVKNPEGSPERHENIRMGSLLNPDHTKRIMMRKLANVEKITAPRDS